MKNINLASGVTLEEGKEWLRSKIKNYQEEENVTEGSILSEAIIEANLLYEVIDNVLAFKVGKTHVATNKVNTYTMTDVMKLIQSAVDEEIAGADEEGALTGLEIEHRIFKKLLEEEQERTRNER